MSNQEIIFSGGFCQKIDKNKDLRVVIKLNPENKYIVTCYWRLKVIDGTNMYVINEKKYSNSIIISSDDFEHDKKYLLDFWGIVTNPNIRKGQEEIESATLIISQDGEVIHSAEVRDIIYPYTQGSSEKDTVPISGHLYICR